MAHKGQGHKCSHKNDYKNQKSLFKQCHARKPIFSLIQHPGAINERHRQIWDHKNRKFEMAKSIKWCQKQTGDKGSAQDRKGLVPQESHCCPLEEPRAPDKTQWQRQQTQRSLLAMAHLWVGGAHAGQHSRKHVPALVPCPAAHGQLEQVHQDAGVIRDQQAGEFIQGLRLWAWGFALAFNALQSPTMKMRNGMFKQSPVHP